MFIFETRDSGLALFIDGVPGMPKENGPRKGSRWIRVDGAVRLIDAPNSRMGLEVDLDLLPWDPFDALGKKVTVLVPSPQGAVEDPEEEAQDLQQAIRFVGHAADRCREFAEAGNGDTSDWWRAFRTWNWLRDHLTAEWEEEPSGDGAKTGLRPDSQAEMSDLPNLPAAASILEYTLGALRTIPLQHWEETVSTLDPEAPSREEAIRTVQILSRLLRRPEREQEDRAPESSPGEDRPTESPAAPPPEPEVRDSPEAGASRSESPDGPEGEEMSFEYASGFDEGYRKGRRVGFALGNHARKRGRHLPDAP